MTRNFVVFLYFFFLMQSYQWWARLQLNHLYCQGIPPLVLCIFWFHNWLSKINLDTKDASFILSAEIWASVCWLFAHQNFTSCSKISWALCKKIHHNSFNVELMRFYLQMSTRKMLYWPYLPFLSGLAVCWGPNINFPVDCKPNSLQADLYTLRTCNWCDFFRRWAYDRRPRTIIAACFPRPGFIDLITHLSSMFKPVFFYRLAFK